MGKIVSLKTWKENRDSQPEEPFDQYLKELRGCIKTCNYEIIQERLKKTKEENNKKVMNDYKIKRRKKDAK